MPDFGNSAYIYPWDKWLDGQIWELELGGDFECDIRTIVSAARQAANRRGGFANARVCGQKVYIKFTVAED
jgi:hypothetical protein